MSFLAGRRIAVSPTLSVGFDDTGRPVAFGPAQQPAPELVLQAVHQAREQLMTTAAALTLWLRQVEADNASPIVRPGPGVRL